MICSRCKFEKISFFIYLDRKIHQVKYCIEITPFLYLRSDHAQSVYSKQAWQRKGIILL
jgi:hypothetical protein